MKTVREVAKELDVTRQTIYSKLTDEFKSKFTTNKTIKGKEILVITTDGIKILKKELGKVDGKLDSKTDSKANNKNDNELMALLSQNSEILRKQLEIKDMQIAELNSRLKEAQELNRNTQVLMRMNNEKMQMIESSENKAKRPWYKSLFGIKDNEDPSKNE